MGFTASIRRRSRLLVAVSPVLLLGACNDDGEGVGGLPVPSPTPTSTPTPVATFAEKCLSLQGTSIPASAISMPTSGAYVGTAIMVAASGTVPEYCKATGAIRSVDPSAPPINFQVNLPSSWNQKAMHFGGGGFNGTVITGLGNVPGTANSGTAIPTPLERGYATFGSDSGHTGGSLSFALNDEAYDNFKGAQLRKTLDTAQTLIKTIYGAAPKRQYFAGGSQGGNESFKVAMRWPEKYDGIVVYFPAANYTAGGLYAVSSVQTIFNTPGGWLTTAKRTLLRSRIMATCDPLDGVSDGVISNYAACQTTFSFSSLRCPSGADEGDTCLSDVQIGVLNKLVARVNFPFAVSGGVTSAPGMPFLLGGTGDFHFGNSPTYNNDASGGIADNVRYGITRDATAKVETHNVSAYAAAWINQSFTQDAATVDMTPFRNRGGKVIWVHGYADSAYPFLNSVDLYNRFNSFFGASSLSQFLRFYGVPGYDHGSGVFNVSFDSVSVLENWVENGVAPGVDALVVADANAATRGRTRPLCEHPKWPKYKGTGDVNLAASYTCSTS